MEKEMERQSVSHWIHQRYDHMLILGTETDTNNNKMKGYTYNDK